MKWHNIIRISHLNPIITFYQNENSLSVTTWLSQPYNLCTLYTVIQTQPVNTRFCFVCLFENVFIDVKIISIMFYERTLFTVQSLHVFLFFFKKHEFKKHKAKNALNLRNM